MTYEQRELEAKKIKAFIGSIQTPEMPDLPDKVGYRWELKYTWGDSSFQWELVEDPNAQGTQNNPIVWEKGLSVKVNYWYTYEGILYVCIQSGTPDEITDTEFFEPM